MRPIVIEGKSVALGPLVREDLERLWFWMNDKKVTQYLGHLFLKVFSLEAERKWLERALEPDDKNLFFAILLKPDYEHIGNIGLHRIDYLNRHAEVGIFIGRKDLWGRGYGSEALILALDIAFNVLELNTVFLRVMEYNERAIKCYSKVGFKFAGRLRRYIYRGGRYWDTILMDITREEFNRNHKSIIKSVCKDVFKDQKTQSSA
ncbi:MAG: GNAT family N-acetyltransferase [Candidatus Njordarchaeales archaeon]